MATKRLVITELELREQKFPIQYRVEMLIAAGAPVRYRYEPKFVGVFDLESTAVEYSRPVSITRDHKLVATVYEWEEKE